MNHAKILYKSTINLYRGSITRSLLFCRSWTGSKRKEAEEVVRGSVHTPKKGRQTFPQQQEVYNLSRQQCQRSRSNYIYIDRNLGRRIIKFIDDLSKMQCSECICPQRRNESWQTKVQATITYQSPRWKIAFQKLSKKIEKKIVRKTTYARKGPDVTLRNTWAQEFRRFKHASGYRE